MKEATIDTVESMEMSSMVSSIVECVRIGMVEEGEAVDAILEAAHLLGRNNGVYTDAQLARRERNDRRRAPLAEPAGVSEEVNEYLIKRRTDELVELANLKPMEEICLRLCICGLTARETASALGLGRHRVEVNLRVARRKVRRVFKGGPYAGWYEVYLSEIRRGR